uniref:Uncharacterized protein n=1 Tax=Arundo donax TaxID=35708 RepID=A0A0A9ESQ6_ARUDO
MPTSMIVHVPRRTAQVVLLSNSHTEAEFVIFLPMIQLGRKNKIDAWS